MIQIGLFAPLILSGIAGALWRERRRKQNTVTSYLASDLSAPPLTLPANEDGITGKKFIVIDDAAEIAHNQRVSLVALAFSSAGSLVFTPFTLASIPLLSYSSFYFLVTLKRSNTARKKSALTIFELASVAGSLIMGRYLLLSSLLAFSFSSRKWSLQAGNISAIGFGNAFNPNSNNIWVQRGNTEIEINISELQENDIAVLHTGDIIKMNGDVVEGKGIVKQCSLKGIIQAVPKQEGDPVFSYTEVAAGDLFVKYH